MSLDGAHNAVIVGGTGSGKTHLAVAIGSNAVQRRRRVRFFNAVDLVNTLEAEQRAAKKARSSRNEFSSDLTALKERMAAEGREIERLAARAQNVTIIRDDFGVPHIYAETDADAWIQDPARRRRIPFE